MSLPGQITIAAIGPRPAGDDRLCLDPWIRSPRLASAGATDPNEQSTVSRRLVPSEPEAAVFGGMPLRRRPAAACSLLEQKERKRRHPAGARLQDQTIVPRPAQPVPARMDEERGREPLLQKL